MLTRFAPSPTGRLHVGNIRTALVCWMYARSQNGKFLLRFDDTDLHRSTAKYMEEILQDLKWIGIDWDLNFKQSERFKRYDEVFLQLLKIGYIYPCYETKEELEVKRKIQLESGLPPVYDRSAMFLSKRKRALYEEKGRKPYFRFRLNRNLIIKWNDKIKGVISIASNHISDPVIRREDGVYTYMLPSVIDDIDFDITHIIRGEDHITNTVIQIQMIHALQAEVQTFAHLPLLHFNKEKISKRKGQLDIQSIKDNEIESMALINYLLKLGTSDPIKAYINIQPLIDSFKIEKFNSVSLNFSFDEIYKINSRILQQMSFKLVKDRLNHIGINSPEFWYFIRSDIKRFSEVAKWWQICKFRIEPVILDTKFAEAALDTLPQNYYCNQYLLLEWTRAIRKRIDIKIKDLFMQLRLALTGIKTGPELSRLLTFISRDNIIMRLKSKI